MINTDDERQMTRAEAVRLLYDTLLTDAYEMCRCIGDGKCFVRAWWETLDKTRGIAK